MLSLGRAEVREQTLLVLQVRCVGLVDRLSTGFGQCDQPAAPVVLVSASSDASRGFESVEPLRDCARGHHRLLCELAGGQLEWWPGAAKRGEDIEFALAQIVVAIAVDELDPERIRDSVEARDDPHGSGVDLGAFDAPLGLNSVDVIRFVGHATTIYLPWKV